MLLGTFWGTYWEPLKNMIRKHNDAPPHSLKDSNASPKVKTIKEGVGVCSLTHNTSGVEKHVGAPR
jgi:hypothetical protein